MENAVGARSFSLALVGLGLGVGEEVPKISSNPAVACFWGLVSPMPEKIEAAPEDEGVGFGGSSKSEV